MSEDCMIHPLADVHSTSIGSGTTIWQFTIVLKQARIGSNCNINSHCFIENDVTIGNNVTVKCGVYLWDGLQIEDNVFIGPNVTFINDKYPKSKIYPKSFMKTIIKSGASIGAGAIIMGGVTIGENALIGAGSLVTNTVAPNTLVYGAPAKKAPKPITDNQYFKTGIKEVSTIFDERGNLSVIEGIRDIPFEIKRVYYIWANTENHQRGSHAHKSLEQVFVAMHGSCKITIDDGCHKELFELYSPASYLLLKSGYWREISDFSKDCVLLVLASEYYDESDYIRDYDEFLKYVKQV